jgi:hypothetical protein
MNKPLLIIVVAGLFTNVCWSEKKKIERIDELGVR